MIKINIHICLFPDSSTTPIRSSVPEQTSHALPKHPTPITHDTSLRHMMTSQLYRTPPGSEISNQNGGSRVLSYDSPLAWRLPVGFAPRL